MTTITILPESVGKDGVTYRAIAGAAQSSGRTAGEALDALAAKLDQAESGLLVIVQSLRPDRFFTIEQQQRLGELMAHWREARDNGSELSPEDQAELGSLIEAEINAATKRAESALTEISR